MSRRKPGRHAVAPGGDRLDGPNFIVAYLNSIACRPNLYAGGRTVVSDRRIYS